MKLNNKGFTFVEILAVIAIIGILSGIAIIGVSRYLDNAKNKDYEALATSAYNGMEEYKIKNPYKKKVSLERLEEEGFISNRKDPATKSTDCTGSVEIKTKTKGSNGIMDENEYNVYLCCTNYKKQFTYPSGEIDEYTGTAKCNVEEQEEIIPIPKPGETTYKITYILNGGENQGNPSEYSSSMLPFTLNIPEKKGNKFVGWTGSNGTTPNDKVTLSVGTTGDKTYTANWKENTCTIKYNANSTSDYPAKFNSNSSNITDTVKYGNNIKLKNINTYYNAKRDWFHINESKEWINGNKIFDQSKTYNAIDICKNLDSEDQTITLNANWQKNRLIINFNSNGGTLYCDDRQTCHKTACDNGTDYQSPTIGDGCTQNKSGIVYSLNRVFDNTNFSSGGLIDYTSGGNLHLTKSGYTQTKKWHIGSKEIDQSTTFKTMRAFAKEIGKENDLKTNPSTTITVTAGWKKS